MKVPVNVPALPDLALAQAMVQHVVDGQQRNVVIVVSDVDA
jgi:hypothetical protein